MNKKITMASILLAGALALPASAEQRTLAGWNLSYTIPDGWRVVQTSGHVEVLGSATEVGVLLVAPGLYRTPEASLADMGRGLVAMGLQARPLEQPARRQLAGMNGVVLTLAAVNRLGQPLRARYFCATSPHGTSLSVLALTRPNRFEALAARAEALIGGLRAAAPQVDRRAVMALAGRWVYYAGKQNGYRSFSGGSGQSYEEQVTFDGQGRFSFRSDSTIHATTGGNRGTMNRSASRADAGSYTVIGNMLVLQGRQGTHVLPLRIAGNGIYAGSKLFIRN